MFPFPSPQCAGGLLQDWSWNPADKNASLSLSNGDRTFVATASSGAMALRAKQSRSSGKRYFEVQIDLIASSLAAVGIGTSGAVLNALVGNGDSVSYGYRSDGQVWNGSAITTYAAYATGDMIGVAIDFSALKLWFAKNNTWQGGGNPAAGTSGLSITSATYFPMGSVNAINSQASDLAALTYAPPIGFIPL